MTWTLSLSPRRDAVIHCPQSPIIMTLEILAAYLEMEE